MRVVFTKIKHIILAILLLLSSGVTWGKDLTVTNKPDTLTPEELQQFLYYFYEAQRLIQNEDIEPAWELVQFCYALNPNDATINNYMGVFYDAFDQPKKVLPYLKRAFELQPNEYWYQYAVYLLQSDDKKLAKLAICNLEQVAQNNPKDEDIHTLLQKAYIHVEDYKRALLIQDQLDSILGYNAASAMQRYRLNMVLHDTKRAISEVQRYLEEEPNDIQFQIFRLELYEQTHQPSDKMIEAYSALLPHQPRNWILLNNLAWHLCISGGDLVMAERLSQTTIMAEPTNSVYLDTYAWIMYNKGNYQDAFFYIQRALEYAIPETKKEIETHYKAILKKLKL